jgi:hypothetical protein
VAAVAIVVLVVVVAVVVVVVAMVVVAAAFLMVAAAAEVIVGGNEQCDQCWPAVVGCSGRRIVDEQCVQCWQAAMGFSGGKIAQNLRASGHELLCDVDQLVLVHVPRVGVVGQVVKTKVERDDIPLGRFSRAQPEVDVQAVQSVLRV